MADSEGILFRKQTFFFPHQNFLGFWVWMLFSLVVVTSVYYEACVYDDNEL